MTATTQTQTQAPKKFRLSEYVKDGYLAEALRTELADLRGQDLELAQEAIIEVATSSIPGTFDELVGEYRRAIRRALHPERRLVKHPQVDPQVIRNPALAAQLNKELKDVTAEELARVNARLKRIIDEARNVTVRQEQGSDERRVTHDPGELCKVRGEHSTLAGECGYFRDPVAWTDTLRGVVRQALEE
ncbi:MAG TPA: hypothetical protein VNL18_15425 [Gemmatimonadales bacterium]|nr:hypothetical protein [Gemmatimonadales bacterium]